MSKEYAILNDQNIVTDVVVADDPLNDKWIEITSSNEEFAGIGNSYDSSTDSFTYVSQETSGDNESRAKELLLDSDWSVLEDVGLTGANIDLWKTYRAALRNIIKNPQAGDLNWPTKPSVEYK